MTYLSSEAVRLADWLEADACDLEAPRQAAALLRRIPELEAEVRQLAKQAASVRSHLTDALAFLLCEKDGNDDPHHLIWEGGAVPEPWGEVWQKYLPDAESLAEAAFKSANDWGLAFDKAEAQALDDAIAERDQLRAIVEGRATGCQCGDDDVCKIVKERDRLSAELEGRWLPIESATEEDENSDQAWLLVDGVVVRGYFLSIPFQEYRDADGFYCGQQDADAYWARVEDGEPVSPTHFQRITPPAAPTPPHADQKGQ